MISFHKKTILRILSDNGCVRILVLLKWKFKSTLQTRNIIKTYLLGRLFKLKFCF